MNEFVVTHTTGEFLVRTKMDMQTAANTIEERWALEIESIGEATPEDIEINQGQWTELDTDA
jgi:hypothetical protein